MGAFYYYIYQNFCRWGWLFRRNEKLKIKKLEQIFIALISAYSKSKNIILVKFSEIKKVFVNKER